MKKELHGKDFLTFLIDNIESKKVRSFLMTRAKSALKIIKEEPSANSLFQENSKEGIFVSAFCSGFLMAITEIVYIEETMELAECPDDTLN